MSLRTRLRRAIEDPSYPSFRLFNISGLLVTVLAVFVVVLETEPWGLQKFPWLPELERVLAAIFAAEYLLRLWSAERPLRYAKSLYGLVDLISFLPTFFSFTNLTFLKTARALRVIRFIRLARIAKVARIEESAKARLDDNDARIVSQNVRVYLATLFSAIVVIGTVAFAVEPQTFSGAFSGAMWATSEILGGGLVPQVVVTPAGKAVAIAARFTGFVLFGFLVNVVAGVVQQTLLDRRRR
jgi:voltage-gated potassium channel